MPGFVKVSQLPSATTITPDDYLLTVDNPNPTGVTKKVTAEKVLDLITEIDGGDLDTP